MKKIVCTLCILSCCMLQLRSQNLRFGINASPTWSWLSTDDKLLEGAGTNWGLKLGVTAEKYFQSNYAVFTGIGFGFNQGGTLQSGYANYRPFTGSELTVPLEETEQGSLPQNSKIAYHLRYVEVPFGLKFRGGSGEDSRLSFYAEAPVITLGFLTQALGDIRGAGSQFDTTDENIRDDVKGIAASWGFGGGIEYELATHTTLVAGLFYQNQFSDATAKGRARRTSTSDWSDEKSKTRPRMLTLRVGVFF